MNDTIESRKIGLMQHFLTLDNIETISKIENLLNDEAKRISNQKALKPFNENEIQDMLYQAEDNFKKGETYSTEEIKDLIEGWK